MSDEEHTQEDPGGNAGSEAREGRGDALGAPLSGDADGAGATPPAPVAGSRPRRLLDPSPRFADSFGLVLVLLLAGLFLRAATGDTPVGAAVTLVVFAAATWLALRASQVRRRGLRVAAALIPLAVLVALVMFFLGDGGYDAPALGAFVTLLLVVVAPLVILRRLLSHPVVNLNTFYGAVSVYILIAMFFATLFSVIDVVAGPFFAQTDHPTGIDFVYFSFVTITTTGYGDLTAAGGVGRLTAVMEAVFGQLYLITVVALVVQNLGRERLSHRRAADDEGEIDAGE